MKPFIRKFLTGAALALAFASSACGGSGTSDKFVDDWHGTVPPSGPTRAYDALLHLGSDDTATNHIVAADSAATPTGCTVTTDLTGTWSEGAEAAPSVTFTWKTGADVYTKCTDSTKNRTDKYAADKLTSVSGKATAVFSDNDETLKLTQLVGEQSVTATYARGMPKK